MEALRAYLVEHDGICVDCEDMRGVCCRAPCDVDSLRPYEAFLRTDPSKPHYFAFLGILLLLCGCCYAYLRRRCVSWLCLEGLFGYVMPAIYSPPRFCHG